MRYMSIQRMHQCWPLQDDAYPRVSMAVDTAFMALGKAKPPLQIQIVVDRGQRVFANEQAGQETHHHRRHFLVDRGLAVRETFLQGLELLPPFGTSLRCRIQRRGDGHDVLHVVTQLLLFGADGVETTVDAVGQTVELRFGEAPFFSSKFRWIDSRTSLNASAIRKPGGCSGPP